MQRLGDIVLCFPLYLWMARTYPGRPIWVVGEPAFYQELLAVSPAVTYIPWTALNELQGRDYSLILNLSHRLEAAALAGQLEAPVKLGGLLDEEGVLRIRGTWQLYRAALTENSRHNRFHWAELNALDCVDKANLPATSFDAPRVLAPGSEKIGLFLGASQEEKRPSPEFWAGLARELEHRGLRVVLLGGPAEVPLGRRVRELLGRPVADFCGRLSLGEFVAVGQTLSLLITPDTGPMHLAAWTGLRVLNLSMGPVSPFETGPYQPGHYVLRANFSCLDCWRCRRPRTYCRERFDPGAVAYLAWRLAGGQGLGQDGLQAPPGLRLYRTGRTPDGFYRLEPLGRGSAADLLGELWRAAFGLLFGLWGQAPLRQAMDELAGCHPRLAHSFRRSLPGLAAPMKMAGAQAGEGSFWTGLPAMIRPLGGYLHMYLQNADFSRQARVHCLELVEKLVTALI